jgi:Secretion system C-terminal sorting domain
MKKLLLLLLSFTLSVFTLTAQRYLTNQFPAVTKTTTSYANNYTVLFVAGGHTIKQALNADVYQPTGDTVSKRPLMIYLITGNFLPRVIPGLRAAASGSREDSAAIEISTRMAKLGYVCAVIDYRLGWNPSSLIQEVRTNTLINASYRGIQDARTAVRFFKANAGTYKIDTSKVMVWGQGTGGYIALGMATLDKYSEILTTKMPAGKFFGTGGVPMVIERLAPPNESIYVNADIEGKILGKVPPGVTGPPPGGDTLNLPNYVANSSDIQFCVNVGGALGDISWIDSKSVPMVSIQCVHDPYAPYNSGVLGVPVNATTSLPVVEVQGGRFVQTFIDDSTTINKKFLSLKDANNPYKSIFAARNGGRYLTGLYPMLGDTVTDSSPYEFFNVNDTLTKYALPGNPRMSPDKARKYIDSMMVFVLPRACLALDLPCASIVSSTEDLLQAYNTKLSISPNPSATFMTFESEAYNPIQAIDVFDLSGRSVRSIKNINSAQYQMDRGGLSSGMYIAKVKFEGGILSKKIVFEKQ